MTDDFLFAVMRSAVFVVSVQKLAATTPSAGLLAACNVAVLVSTTMSGLAAYAVMLLAVKFGKITYA